MKRDLDLIRRMLLHIEETSEPYSGRLAEFEMPDEDDGLVWGHLRLLAESGLIDHSGGSGARGAGKPPTYLAPRLTMRGHDYLDAVRDKSVWAKVKARIGDKGSSVPLEVVMAIGIAILKEKLGLGSG